MKLIVNRVLNASLTIDNNLIGSIEKGLVVYVGFKEGDNNYNTDWEINKLLGLRIFEDTQGKMNLSTKDVDGQLMIIPNFTLYADTSHGFRPGFSHALSPELARAEFESFCNKILALFGNKIVFGSFGADMKINQTNDGPINIIIEKN